MKIVLTETQIRRIIAEDAAKLGYVGDSAEYKAQLNSRIQSGSFDSETFKKFSSMFNRSGSLDNGMASVQNMSGNQVAQQVKTRIMKDLGWTEYQAAALLGIIQCESGFKVAAVNQREKAGTYTGSAANGTGYGAGLIQWSLGRKTSALKMLQHYNAMHKISSRPNSVEECTLDDQITMIELELTSGNLNNLVKQTKDVREALKVLYTYYVGGWNPNASQIPSDAQTAQIANKYARINGGDGFGKRLSAAQNFC